MIGTFVMKEWKNRNLGTENRYYIIRNKTFNKISYVHLITY